MPRHYTSLAAKRFSLSVISSYHACKVDSAIKPPAAADCGDLASLVVYQARVLSHGHHHSTLMSPKSMSCRPPSRRCTFHDSHHHHEDTASISAFTSYHVESFFKLTSLELLR